ncbi:hypothetical protein [Microbacterium elymi]|uniref:Uncharacterized protein n=1 Tax=Microbacterium elymi TaxID=2909587 RepID=A0ABY5NIV1_9MICO|nr:hypothetical protein [Microbacterium elymi]UUT35104.1 hypothetical protein L2X98_33080 [Microbacterium elymi]
MRSHGMSGWSHAIQARRLPSGDSAGWATKSLPEASEPMMGVSPVVISTMSRTGTPAPAWVSRIASSRSCCTVSPP